MEKKAKIYVAGHTGMVGSAVVRKLRQEGYGNLILKTHAELNLLDQFAARRFFELECPEYVILCAARVGGIKANMTYPAEFLYENLQIQNNVIWQAHLSGVKKLLFLGSSCAYPRECDQPMKEEYLLSGKPEPTNEGYALAKIAGIKLCQGIYHEYHRCFISCVPTNVYGSHDNFDLESSHVLPAIIRKFHEAMKNGSADVTVWGTGESRREFLYVDDLVDACLFLMKNYDKDEVINIGTGEDVSIKELVDLVSQATGFKGRVVWDASKPDGMPRKLLDVSKIHNLGWKHHVSLEEGIKRTIDFYSSNNHKI